MDDFEPDRTDPDTDGPAGTDRRTMMRRMLVGGAVIWATPVFSQAAFAAPRPSVCSYSITQTDDVVTGTGTGFAPGTHASTLSTQNGDGKNTAAASYTFSSASVTGLSFTISGITGSSVVTVSGATTATPTGATRTYTAATSTGVTITLQTTKNDIQTISVSALAFTCR